MAAIMGAGVFHRILPFASLIAHQAVGMERDGMYKIARRHMPAGKERLLPPGFIIEGMPTGALCGGTKSHLRLLQLVSAS